VDNLRHRTIIQLQGLINLHMHMVLHAQYKNTTEATVDAARIILRQCERSGTVRRVIYTASVTAASPLREGGGGYKDFINESCWTPHAARPPLRVQQRPPGRKPFISLYQSSISWPNRFIYI